MYDSKLVIYSNSWHVYNYFCCRRPVVPLGRPSDGGEVNKCCLPVLSNVDITLY